MIIAMLTCWYMFICTRQAVTTEHRADFAKSMLQGMMLLWTVITASIAAYENQCAIAEQKKSLQRPLTMDAHHAAAPHDNPTHGTRQCPAMAYSFTGIQRKSSPY